MKQNIFGVILFSIIVGTAIFVSEFFAVIPVPPTVIERPVYESKNSCKKVLTQMPSKSPAKLRVVQAVLNPQTNKLNTSLEIERADNSNAYFGVTYHFFVKDGGKTGYLRSETFGVQPEFGREKKVNHEILSSYAWLDNLDNKDNLYLIVEPSFSGFSSNKPISGFDESKAVPVLLMKER